LRSRANIHRACLAGHRRDKFIDFGGTRFDDRFIEFVAGIDLAGYGKNPEAGGPSAQNFHDRCHLCGPPEIRGHRNAVMKIE
jgi:hypothetical protein